MCLILVDDAIAFAPFYRKFVIEIHTFMMKTHGEVFKNLSGLGLDATLYSTGTITGKFLGPGLPSPENFAGLGKTFSGGAGIATGGKWEGYDDAGKIIWKGSFEGYSIGIPQLNGAGSGVKTRTRIFSPKRQGNAE